MESFPSTLGSSSKRRLKKASTIVQSPSANEDTMRRSSGRQLFSQCQGSGRSFTSFVQLLTPADICFSTDFRLVHIFSDTCVGYHVTSPFLEVEHQQNYPHHFLEKQGTFERKRGERKTEVTSRAMMM